jgi:hypothetical protein
MRMEQRPRLRRLRMSMGLSEARALLQCPRAAIPPRLNWAGRFEMGLGNCITRMQIANRPIPALNPISKHEGRSMRICRFFVCLLFTPVYAVVWVVGGIVRYFAYLWEISDEYNQ